MLTADELAGYNLFRGKANCNSLPSGWQVHCAIAHGFPRSEDNGTVANVRPLFTCFGSANLGLPLNPRDAIYYQKHAGFLRLHRKSLWLRLQRSGTRNFPAKRSRLLGKPE